MAFEAHIDTILNRHRELGSLMADPAQAGNFMKLSKEYAGLQPVVDAAQAYQDVLKEFADLEALMNDPDMKDIATQEYYALKEKIPALEEALHLTLLPKDAADEGNAILEIRAGTGGDEAGLFAADLLRMYKAYAAVRGWRFDIMDLSESDVGGIKEGIVSVEGAGVFARLKFESGVHRVQRVPQTETQGRVHTSAATVAVLPEAQEADVEINANDLKVDTYRASGAGGQHVNRTDSAIRITHIPTNTVVTMQEERSQHKNRAKAMAILKSRILAAQREKLDSERAADRKSQVGSGDRSERIRTYNFPQGRVTDHRVDLTVHGIDRVMNGQDLDKIIDALIREDQAERMATLQGEA